ncbi:hypothetical protein BH11MYX2_BH11MYX2_29070 [soil metagenome]
MKKLALTLAISAASIAGLAACGSKQPQPTTPSNSADAKTGAMGGKTYGGTTITAPTPPTGGTPAEDPCAMP